MHVVFMLFILFLSIATAPQRATALSFGRHLHRAFDELACCQKLRLYGLQPTLSAFTFLDTSFDSGGGLGGLLRMHGTAFTDRLFPTITLHLSVP